jgi:hypothetical protein
MKVLNLFLGLALALGSFFGSSAPATAHEFESLAANRNVSEYNLQGTIGLKGFDPVAVFPVYAKSVAL